jgi:hypothetical protein
MKTTNEVTDLNTHTHTHTHTHTVFRVKSDPRDPLVTFPNEEMGAKQLMQI